MSAPVPVIPGHLAPPHVAKHLQIEVARLLERRSTTFPGSQPVSFARHHIADALMVEDYFVCEKSDGIRCLMFLTQEHVEGGHVEERVYLITRKNEYYLIPDLHFPRTTEDLSSFHVGALIDGELVIGKRPDGSHELKYLIFDCLALDGILLVSRTLDKRLGFLRQGLYKPYTKLFEKYPDDCKMFPFKVYFKDMERSYGLKKVLLEVLPNLRHVSDGLIFTCRVSPYVFGTDEKILKWKSPEENTIDFRVSLEFPKYTDPYPAPDADEDEITYVNYDAKPEFVLQVWHGGKEYQEWGEMYVTDEEWEKMKSLHEPLHERVVECYKDENQRWRYMRFRDDKEHGNHISIVDKVMQSINDCVTKEELLEVWPKIQEKWKEREREDNLKRERERERGARESVDHKRQRI